MPDAVRNNIGAFPSYLWNDEAQIINRIITEVLNRKCVISVHNGEEWSVKKSSDRKAIQKEVAATDITQFRVRDAEGQYAGWFMLIHGNRTDVLSDYSDNEFCEEIWQAIKPTVERLEANL
jgi:hypothetical protein